MSNNVQHQVSYTTRITEIQALGSVQMHVLSDGTDWFFWIAESAARSQLLDSPIRCANLQRRRTARREFGIRKLLLQ
jgi:hypothetical protein